MGQVEVLCLFKVLPDLGRAIALNGEATAQLIIRASGIEEKEWREDFITIFLDTLQGFVTVEFVTVEVQFFGWIYSLLADVLDHNRSSILSKDIWVCFNEIGG